MLLETAPYKVQLLWQGATHFSHKLTYIAMCDFGRGYFHNLTPNHESLRVSFDFS
jgi:hypothetical protein